jgi:predicted esterase
MSGMGGMGGTGGMVMVGDRAPTIPVATEACPAFVDDTITFMDLGGIEIVAGAKAAGPTAPMVFYWHGTGSSAGEYAGWTDIVSGVRSEGGVLVSFDGTTGGDSLSGTSIFGRSDLELVDQLVACAVANHNVDPRRIYTTGCSAGGLFATAMAALRSSYVAAAAPNSGGLTFAGAVSFEDDYTPALMTMHGGSSDNVLGLDFAMSSRTADTAFKNHGGFVINCDHGGRHCGARALAGNIWDFFKAHPYGVEPAPSPWTSGLPSGFSSDCAIFE